MPGREPLPGLDLSPSRLRRDGPALLSQGNNQAATAPAVLYFWGGAIGSIYAVVIAGHSRSKNGVASLAYDPAIQLFVRAD